MNGIRLGRRATAYNVKPMTDSELKEIPSARGLAHNFFQIMSSPEISLQVF